LWAAEEAGLEVFLTMDQRFWRVVNQKKKTIDSVIPVMTPKELGELLNAQPTDIEKLAAEISPFS
jgi:protoporphyrinogen oxidase